MRMYVFLWLATVASGCVTTEEVTKIAQVEATKRIADDLVPVKSDIYKCSLDISAKGREVTALQERLKALEASMSILVSEIEGIKAKYEKEVEFWERVFRNTNARIQAFFPPLKHELEIVADEYAIAYMKWLAGRAAAKPVLVILNFTTPEKTQCKLGHMVSQAIAQCFASLRNVEISILVQEDVENILISKNPAAKLTIEQLISPDTLKSISIDPKTACAFIGTVQKFDDRFSLNCRLLDLSTGTSAAISGSRDLIMRSESLKLYEEVHETRMVQPKR